jgi:hypothetical protein
MKKHTNTQKQDVGFSNFFDFINTFSFSFLGVELLCRSEQKKEKAN